MVTLKLRRQEVEELVELLESQVGLEWPLAGLAGEFREACGMVSRDEELARHAADAGSDSRKFVIPVEIFESDMRL